MPRFSLNVAERTTGTKCVVELEAPTEEGAIAEAGNLGYVIESIRQVPPALSIPYATPALPPRRRNGMLIALASSILCMFIAACWLFFSGAAAPVAPVVMPPMAMPTPPKPREPQFRATRRWFENDMRQKMDVVFEITCLEATPITVTNVTFNRTHYAFEGKETVGRFVPVGTAPIQLRTMKFGDRLIAWKDTLERDFKGDYTGQVVLLSIHTDRGTTDFVLGDD